MVIFLKIYNFLSEKNDTGKTSSDSEYSNMLGKAVNSFNTRWLSIIRQTNTGLGYLELLKPPL